MLFFHICFLFMSLFAWWPGAFSFSHRACHLPQNVHHVTASTLHWGSLDSSLKLFISTPRIKICRDYQTCVCRNPCCLTRHINLTRVQWNIRRGRVAKVNANCGGILNAPHRKSRKRPTVARHGGKKREQDKWRKGNRFGEKEISTDQRRKEETKWTKRGKRMNKQQEKKE